MAKSAQQMADRFKTGLSGAGKSYTDGIASVTVNPAAKAMAAKDKWATKIQEAIANDTFAAGLANVTKESWQQAATAAASKFTGSANTAATKYNKYAMKAAPIIAQIQQQIDAMPNTTDQDAEARVIANMQAMRQLKGITRR